MMPLSLDPVCPSQPLSLDTFLVDSSAAGDLSGNFFLTNFFLLHSLPYSFHFANLCTSYSCHFSNLSTSLLFSFTTSLLSLFPTLRISRLFPFPAFFIRRFLTSPFFHFPTLFPFLASSGSNVASDLGNKDSALGSKSLESWIYGWRSLGLWNLWCKGFRVHGFRVKRN